MEGLPSLNQPLTLVVESESPIAPQALKSMQKELANILARASVKVDWVMRSDFKLGSEAEDLVLVKFKGSCRMEMTPALLDERGPLAFTHTTDGEVLPFSVVLCDKVRVAAQSAMWGGDYARGNELFGRALARVLAHELYHILGKEEGHGKDGVARRALSGQQLISDRLELAPSDAAKMHR